jgi:hypothetical protein
MRNSRPRRALVLVGILGLLGSSLTAAAHRASAPLTFTSAYKLPDSKAGSEPRVIYGPDNTGYLITNTSSGTAVVYTTTDHGLHWKKTAADPAGQSSPTIDTDVVVGADGRIIATELDSQGITFRTSYSDDGGKTWTKSTGMVPADTDRQFLATGPDGLVYMVWHNLVSGAGVHNIFVQTSTDNGASFGAPVPVTMPGDQAFAELQCADGYPSSLSVNPKTGRLYVAFGTRTAPAGGGCGASAVGTFEINIVSPTRVWIATSPDNSPGSWTQSLAVDDSQSGKVVGMVFSPGGLDSRGNYYVTYPESRSATDYTGAVKYVWADPMLKKWSKPITVAPIGSGHILPHVVAGDPGRLFFAYFEGVGKGEETKWYSTVSQTIDGTSASPHFTKVRLSDVPTYEGSQNIVLGHCGSGATAGLQAGFLCSRSADIYGLAIDNDGRLTVTWPSTLDELGTYVTTQKTGPSAYAAE